MIHYNNRLMRFTMSAFLFLYMAGTSMLPALAAADPRADAEARKSLPVETNSYENWPYGPAIGAESAILLEANTGTILYAKNIHEHLYPASTTKILTCLIASEKCKMDERVKMSHKAVFTIPRDSSNVGLDEGEEISVEECLYAILVGSANEAANAIGEHISGSMEDFAVLMNERAKELGCEDSHFVTTNGLHDDEHYTSAYDLALIAKAFFLNELLCKMSSTTTYHIPQSATQPDDDLYIHSKNKLYAGATYAYEGLLGSKTGYTDIARQTLVSCAQRGNMKLVCVIMKEESPEQFTDTVSLFDYGFDKFQALTVSEYETSYSVSDHDLFPSENAIFGSSTPLLSLNGTDTVVLPITAVFDDLDSTLSYDTDKEDAIAEIFYTYHGIPVGSATIDVATSEKKVAFDFSNQKENQKPDLSKVHREETPVIFINVRQVIFYVSIGAAGLILLCVIHSIISNYHFAKRRKSKLRRKKRKRVHSPFDDFDF